MKNVCQQEQSDKAIDNMIILAFCYGSVYILLGLNQGQACALNYLKNYLVLKTIVNRPIPFPAALYRGNAVTVTYWLVS